MSTITEQIGRVLAGRYRLDAGIGTGSSAHVYLAFDARLRRRVAVKLLHPGLAGDEAFLRQFRAEAQAVAALNHPNVLRVFDWGEEPDGPFLVLEHLGGGSLRDLLDAGARLSPAQAATVGAEAARGLAYAHRRGFVHRDVKPANLLFDEDGRVRIADFGLARALADAGWTEPVGTVLGTARYASPEQAEGRPLDDRSDVYSLALSLYEAIVGRAPFGGDTTVATLVARVGARLPTPAELGPLAPILAQAALADPLARLDARELAEHLELLARTLPLPAPLPLAPAAAPALAPGAAPARRAAVLFDGEALEGRADPHEHASAGPPADAGGPEVDEAGAEAAAHAEPGGARTRRARRHRTGRRVASVLGLLVLAAGGAAATLRYVVFSHRVPSVVATTLAAARRSVARDGLRLAVSARRYSSSAPSGVVLSQSLVPGALVRSHEVVRVVVSRGPAPVAVPPIAGATRAVALVALGRAHLRAAVTDAYSEHVPAGTVVAERPARGLAPYGSTVALVVSSGPAPRTIPATLVGASWGAVRDALVALRLVPVARLVYSGTVPSGEVVATRPAGGTGGVPVGARITVVVSRGPRLVRVVPVAGDTIAEAVAALEAEGLVVSEAIGPPFATHATTTDPAPGALVRPGTSVTLYDA